jgi:hypothetical protein
MQAPCVASVTNVAKEAKLLLPHPLATAQSANVKMVITGVHKNR